MSSNRLSTASTGSNKRWSLPSLEPLADFSLDGAPSARPERPPMQQSGSSGRSSQRNSVAGQGQSRRASLNRASISGTSYGKSDFGVPLTSNTIMERKGSGDRRGSVDRRMSKRMSRVSKLSDLSEAESDRTHSRILSIMTVDSEIDPASRRRSTRLSISEQLADNAMQKRLSRRLSSNSILEGTRMSYMNRTLEWQQRPEDLQKDVSWDDDLKKPSNWVHQKKLVNTLVASVLAFCYTFTMSIYAAAPSDQLGKISSSKVLTVLPYSAYLLGFAFGPALATPFEKAYGRKITLFGSLPLFAVCLLGAAVSKTIAALTILRFLAALFAAPGFWLTFTVVSEVWIGSCETIAVAFYMASLVLGCASGPIVGGVITNYTTWHWTEYTALILVIVIIFTNVAMSETQEDAIKRKKKTSAEVAQEVAEKAPHRRTRYSTPSRLHFKGNFMFKRPLKMLRVSPSLSMVTLYLSYTLAVLVTLPLLSLPAFGKAYAYSNQARGFTYAAVPIGVIGAVVFVALMDRFVYLPKLRRWDQEIDADNEKGTVEMVGPQSNAHASWRKGVAVSRTRNLGLRSSMISTDSSTMRSNSETPSFASSTTSKREKRRSRHQAFSERNINVAIAVTRFLNAQPENSGSKIIVERVMVLLKDTSSFTEICAALSKLGLVFEDALLAQTVTTAIKAEKASADIALARSRSLHRLTAQAALMGSADAPDETSQDTLVPRTASDDSQPVPAAPAVPETDSPVGPPPEWRWLPALPATLLFPAGLALFAWTLRPGTSWIVPCVGLGVAGLGAALIMTCAYAYLLELHWDQSAAADARAPATMIGFVLSAVISLVAVAVVDAIGLGAAVSIFAGIAAVGGVVPWWVAFSKKA